MTGERVCAAERDDAKSGCGFAGFRHESLEDFVDGAIASASKDNLRTAASGISRLDGCRPGSSGGYEFDGMANRGKSLSNLAELVRAKFPFAARGRVIDEGTAHVIILRWNFQNNAVGSALLASYTALSVSSAQRA